MGKRGPKPTPREILKLRGSRRAGYNPDQPDPPAGRPKMPSGMPDAAKTKWREIVKQLVDLGVVARLDATMLEQFCRAWAHAQTCEQWIAEHGSVFVRRDKEGRIASATTFPQVVELRHLREYIQRTAAEFGLTPSSRTRISVVAKPKMDKLDEFLAGQAS